MVPTGHPGYYFAVDDIEAATAKTRSLAGEAEEKQTVPGIGWFTACKDSEGNVFHVFQADDEAVQEHHSTRRVLRVNRGTYARSNGRVA